MDEKLAKVWGEKYSVPNGGVPGLTRLGGVHSFSNGREETIEKTRQEIKRRLFSASKAEKE